MSVALRRHDEIVRSAIESNGGGVFKTIGDAFCAAFARPIDALEAALAASRSLAAEDFSAVDGIRVRFAIHTGISEERDGDHFGPTVNRVARLLSIGAGGQILISAATADLVERSLPVSVSLRDLGEHRLRDLSRVERVYQLSASDLVDVATPLRSLGSRPNNLPIELSSFIGRESEIAEVSALLDRHPIVTVTGSGGIGKTRTSLQVAARVSAAFPDGVWFVELAALADGDYVASAIAQAARIALGVADDPLEAVASALVSSRALIVLDNCEHLVAACAGVVATITRRASDVKILASSRQSLGVRGEGVYRLAPLGETLAIALFVERARAIDHRFALTEENADAVVEICRRLDGIALAIELAAARVRILAPRQLRDRLDERFRMLVAARRDVLPRQQTLRALIDWSHDLLDGRERKLFRRLGTFADGFTLEAATYVASDGEPDDIDCLDELESLVDKSLVLAETGADEARYRLLESTRAFAREKLEEASELDACDDRRLEFLTIRATTAREIFHQTLSYTPLATLLARELEDIRAALDLALATPATVDRGCALTVLFAKSWQEVDLDYEGVVRTFAALEAEPKDEVIVARLEVSLAYLELNMARRESSLEFARRSVARARRLEDRLLLTEALLQVARVASVLGLMAESARALAEAETNRDVHPLLELTRVKVRAYLAGSSGDSASAEAAYRQIADRSRMAGSTEHVRSSLINLAEFMHRSGRTHLAIVEARAALAESATKNLAYWNAAINLVAYLAAADAAEATELAHEILRELGTAQPIAFVALTLGHLSFALAQAGDLPRAAALEGYASAVLDAQGFAREFTEQLSHDRVSALLRERYDELELAERLAAGASLSRDEAVLLALTCGENQMSATD